jgi:hypothetical protein
MEDAVEKSRRSRRRVMTGISLLAAIAGISTSVVSALYFKRERWVPE